jgi:hypothetical protein
MRALRLAVPISLLTMAMLAAGVARSRGAATASTPATAGPRVLSTVPAALSPAAFAAHLSGKVSVHVHVTPTGLADSVRATVGATALRATAESAARWYVFDASPKGGWTDVVVDVAPAAADDDPLSPDFVASAIQAEKDGDLRGALDWWLGALNKVGTHPELRNPWAVREQTLRIATAMHPAPPVPHVAGVTGMGLSAQLERTVARLQHQDIVGLMQPILLEAPWWADAYRCLAAAQSGSGQLLEARRTLRFYQMAADSAGRVRAANALRMLAVADTIGASEVLKKQPLKPEKEAGE